MSDERWPMTPWYDPGQLASTGSQIATSTILGHRADYRLIEALGKPVGFIRRDAGEEIGIDYVADVGDGWASTYAIARLLGEARLEPRGGTSLPRGQLLVMGGDCVYPTPSRERYDEKLVAPYRDALPQVEGEPPLLVAIPGNHDWYDGLTSFMRKFCQRSSIGAWRTEQQRSYFAVRLPQRWWLLGVDVQLESDIDLPQLEYFRELGLRAGDNLILCTPEPDWVYGNIYDPKLQNNLAALQEELEKDGAAVRVRIAGDLHHYRRHEAKGLDARATTPAQYITCGGGGAFLHPTYLHAPQKQEKVELARDELRIGYADSTRTIVKKKAFPTEARSFALILWNLLFPLLNPTFGFLTAFLYTVLAWVLTPAADRECRFERVFANLPDRPSGLAWAAIILVAFVLFTDTSSKWYRWIAGLVHGSTHVLAAIGMGILGHRLAGPDATHVGVFAVETGVAALGGYLVGGELMGLYLLISLMVFRRHANETFSALRNRHWKCFLRMRIDRTGLLTIHAIGLRHVPPRRAWVRSSQPGVAWQLDGGRRLEPELIETVTVTPVTTSQTPPASS